MDSKRSPLRTKLGSPAVMGSESGNPSDVPVLSENRAVDLSENRVAGPPRSKLGSPATMGTKRQQAKTQSQPETGCGGWGKKLHAQRRPGLAQRCV